MSLEKIVRPFQLGDTSPPKPVATGNACVAANTITLTFGLGGSAKVLHGSVSIDESFYAVKKMREKTTST